MDETLADEFDDDIMSHSDDDDNNNNNDDDDEQQQQQQQHQQRHKSPPIKRPTSIGNFHKESKKQKQHLDTFTNDHQKITHNKCENDAHRDTKMPAQHANRVANVSGRLSFNRPSLDDNNNSSNNNNTNHNNHNHIEHDFEDDDDDEEDDDDEDDADDDDEVDEEDEEEIEDDDDDDEQDMSRDVDHFAAIANNTQVNNNNNHKNAIINDDQAQELNLNINDTNNNNINNNNDDDDDEDEDDNDLGPMHDSNINSEQISPSRRHNIELRNISQQHPNNNNNNNNHRANTNNELVKQMIRLEDHLTSFGDKLKSHERRLMAIESTSQDIYIKLNHLILALESLVSQPQQQFPNNGSDINQTSHHQVNQISSALNANNSNNNNNGNQNNANNNNNNNNHNNSINQSSNNNNNNQTGAINNGTNATLTSLILNSASSNPNINETSTGSSRHSSASVSPSLGAQSALSTSVAASPTSQHHLNLSHLNLNHLSHQLASSIGNELAGANSAASDPNGANLSSLGGALRLANQHHQDTQSTVAAMAAASQFLSALGHLRGGGQLSHLDLTAAQSHLLASTLNVAALNASTNIHQQQSNNDMATNLSSHLLKTANQQQASNNHHIDNHLSNSSSNNNINNINSNSNNNNNNNNNININSNPAGINRINSPSNQSMAQQLASLQASHNPTAAAAAAVAAQLSAAAAAAAASGNNRSLSSGGSSSSHHHHSHHNSHHSSHHHSHNPSSNSHQAHQAAVPSSNGSSAGSVSNQPPTINTSSRQQLRQQPIVHSVPHPHSHHALSYPAAAAAAASLLINSPYQTVRTKYSTRRYSRRRVGPEEAMADPSIRATVELKMPVVPKTILIVLKHRLTVQTAITLACGDTNERLRKGAIQKKLEAMFREPGAVDAFMNEWDPYKNLPVTSIQPSM